MKFIDSAEIYVRSGDGGRGHISFRREKYVPKGGPDGGNGGKGGDIVFVASNDLNTLLDFHYKRKYTAENGKPGEKANRSGRDGKDLKIKVPIGTMIYNADTGELLADLTADKQQVVIAKGGRGGLGNANFATPTNQAPRFAQPGEPGVELNLRLELKLLADVGLVGFPNVGKSTLISVISAAKPKIADYPFTTLVPNLGVVKIDEYKSFVVADIPGLIEGASMGKGLGHQFLKHIERTRLLVFLLDINSENIIKDYEILSNELELYNIDLTYKPRIICISKCDTVDSQRLDEISKIIVDSRYPEQLLISSITQMNIEKLKFKMWDLIMKIPQPF